MHSRTTIKYNARFGNGTRAAHDTQIAYTIEDITMYRL